MDGTPEREERGDGAVRFPPSVWFAGALAGVVCGAIAEHFNYGYPCEGLAAFCGGSIVCVVYLSLRVR